MVGCSTMVHPLTDVRPPESIRIATGAASMIIFVTQTRGVL